MAAIRETKGIGTEFIFNESARIFTLAKGKAEHGRRLRSAHKKGTPLKVTLDSKGAFIHHVAEAKASEREAFERKRIPLPKPDPGVPYDSSKVTPVTFDVIDRAQRWGVLKLCTKVVPSYAKAKEIFDYCANLACALPGPYAVDPCIPFQYVNDGCYARAHQMRRVIMKKYGYCCDKVFSFANKNSDTLAVHVTALGACCVKWWYHVAPLISVKTTLKLPASYPRRKGKGTGTIRLTINLAYVIDPSMFDKPVLLSQWLAAQEFKDCTSHAHVSMYSIQPGSAYAPADYSGTSFDTDPDYSKTEQTLINYKNKSTIC